ncbi:hypothetical protein MMC16_006422 [Acarospora aff. strigata]|nr:hypothetical protein [Acarospora aff. strigata]
MYYSANLISDLYGKRPKFNAPTRSTSNLFRRHSGRNSSIRKASHYYGNTRGAFSPSQDLETESTTSYIQTLPTNSPTAERMNHERPTRLSNDSFAIRGFTDLHLERNYLLDSLQKANEQATRLARLLAHTQTKLHRSYVREKSVSHFKRQCKKLEQRLRECENTEKAILNNLGRVTWRIQATERWMDAEQYRKEGAPTGKGMGMSQITQDLGMMMLDPRPLVHKPQGWDRSQPNETGFWTPEHHQYAQFDAGNWVSPFHSPYYNPGYNHFYAHDVPPSVQIYQPILHPVPESDNEYEQSPPEVFEADARPKLTNTSTDDSPAKTQIEHLLQQNTVSLKRVRTKSLPIESENGVGNEDENEKRNENESGSPCDGLRQRKSVSGSGSGSVYRGYGFWRAGGPRGSA